MDVCYPYNNEEVDSVTKYLTTAFDRLPYPRDVEVALIKQKSTRPNSNKCERCDGPGYYKEDFEEYDCGLKNFEGPKWIRCYCTPGDIPNGPVLDKARNIRDRSIALILAKKIGQHAIDNKVISSIKQWGFYCWTPETYKLYLNLSREITMNGLLHFAEILKEFDPIDCQTMPLEVTREIVDRIKLMPAKKWINDVSK